MGALGDFTVPSSVLCNGDFFKISNVVSAWSLFRVKVFPSSEIHSCERLVEYVGVMVGHFLVTLLLIY